MISSNQILTAIVILGIIFLVFEKSISTALLETHGAIGKATARSDVDGQLYKVQNSGNEDLNKRAANALAKLRKKLDYLVYNCEQVPQDLKIRLRNRYCSSCIYERGALAEQANGLLTGNLGSSFTVNKRDMVYCLKPKGSLDLHDENLLTFVGIHELAHIATISEGHKEDFYKNFKQLLRVAVDSGIWTYVDYSKNPTNYCGITVNNSLIAE